MGITQESVFGSSDIYSIAYGNGVFVAGGVGKVAYASSNDILTWTAVSPSIFNSSNNPVAVKGIAYGNGMFVAGGDLTKSSDYSRVGISVDGGVTWQTGSVSLFGQYEDFSAVAYGASKFVAVSTEGKIGYSSDGKSWTAINSTNSTFGSYNSICAIVYGNGKFVAGSMYGNMATSQNGMTWTAEQLSSFGSSGIYGIAYGEGKFVAVGESGKIACWKAE